MSEQTSTDGNIIMYGKDHSIDLSKCPESSIQALLRKGLAHYLGNEQASKVTALKTKTAEAGNVMSMVELEVAKLDFVKAAIEALYAGTVGTQVRGPRTTPLESLIRQFAGTQVKDILRKNNLAIPSGDKRVTFPNGQSFTMAELIDRQLAKPESFAKFEKAAQAELKRREREAEKVGGLDELI